MENDPVSRPRPSKSAAHGAANMSDSYERFTRGVWLAVPLLLAAAVAGLLWLEWDAHRRLAQLEPILHTAGETARVVGGAAADLEKTLKDEHKAEADQLAAAAALQAKATAAADGFANLLNKTDDSLNGKGGVLPVLAGAIADQNANMNAISLRAEAAIDTLNATIRDIQPLLAAATTAAQNGASLSGDPRISEALGRIDDATLQANDILEHLDMISASGDRDAAMLETRLRQALKPASLAKELFERILQVGPPIATAVRTP